MQRQLLLDQIRQKEEIIAPVVQELETLKSQLAALDKNDFEYRLSHPDELKEMLKELNSFLYKPSDYGKAVTALDLSGHVPKYQKKLLARGLGMEKAWFRQIIFVGHIQFTEKQKSILRKYKMKWIYDSYNNTRN